MALTDIASLAFKSFVAMPTGFCFMMTHGLQFNGYATQEH